PAKLEKNTGKSDNKLPKTYRIHPRKAHHVRAVSETDHPLETPRQESFSRNTGSSQGNRPVKKEVCDRQGQGNAVVLRQSGCEANAQQTAGRRRSEQGGVSRSLCRTPPAAAGGTPGKLAHGLGRQGREPAARQPDDGSPSYHL